MDYIFRESGLADREKISTLYERSTNWFKTHSYATSWFTSLYSMVPYRVCHAVIESDESGMRGRKEIQGYCSAVALDGSNGDFLRWKVIDLLFDNEVSFDPSISFLVFFISSLNLSGEMYVKADQSFLEIEITEGDNLEVLLQEELGAERIGSIRSVTGKKNIYSLDSLHPLILKKIEALGIVSGHRNYVYESALA